MEIFKQLAIILMILECGKMTNKILNIPIPGSVIGMVLLLILLNFKILKIEKIERLSNFLLDNLAFLFIPATVSVMESYKIIKSQWIQIITICVITTVIVFGVTGFVVEKIIKVSDKDDK